MRCHKLWGMAAVAALAATLLVSPFAGGTGDSGPGSAAPPPDQIRESVDYLVSTYGVSTAEAVRRVVLDADSADVGRRLARALPDEYAGM
ncbi:MAG TPA: hypothetical protein VLJ59_07290 [Mycobacteriales bacterium]|nr:hypothetical protein [Mycobacteriales bacterium]